MKKHYDICVAGFWYGANYGSLLNGYAEYRLLKSFGKEVLMLQKPNAKPDDPEITTGHNTAFIQKYYDAEDISPALPYSELPKLNEICDCFCAGSDQIWNYDISFHENMYLPFASDDKKLISFATSLGHKVDKTPDFAKSNVRKYLHRYSAISVREQFDVDILRDNYGLNATLVFEPVFCIDKQIYEDLAEDSSFNEPEPYLLTYILDPTPEKRDAVLYYAEKLGMKVVNILDGVQSMWQRNKEMLNLPNTIPNVGTQDFLKAFMNASYVITDSFHGSAFSIIFNKPFFAIGNHNRGYERFVDLLGRLKLTDRLVSDPEKIPHDEKYLAPIDYTEINQIIASEAKRTVDWFRYAVETPKSEMPSIKIGTSQTAEPVRKKTVRERQGEYYKILTTRPIVLLGAGPTAVDFCNRFHDKLDIQCVLTEQEKETSLKLKNGKVLPVKKYAKHFLRDDDFIIVCRGDIGDIYKNAKSRLVQDGLKLGKDFLCSHMAAFILEQRKLITFVGYCQLEVIWDICTRLEGVRTEHALRFFRLNRDTVKESYRYDDYIEYVKISDIVVYVPLFAAQGKTDASVEGLMACDARKCTFPRLAFRGLHPYKASNLETFHELTRIRGGVHWPFLYAEQAIDKLIQEGKSNDEIYAELMREDFISAEDVEKNFKLACKTIKISEKNTDVKMLDYIQDNFQKKLLYRDCLHYQNCMYFEIMRRMTKCLGLEINEDIDKLEAQCEADGMFFIDFTEIPILPSVAKHLDITFVTEETRYRVRNFDRSMQYMTRKEWIYSYCDYTRSIIHVKKFFNV